MMNSRGQIEVLFFGGNGHAPVRLERVHPILAHNNPPIALVEVPYPGFEGRPPAVSLDGFRDAVAQFCRLHPNAQAAVATGIGGLLALALRADGELSIPLIFEAPVLWGLKDRLLPRVMRSKPLRDLLAWSFRQPVFQKVFLRRYFVKPLDQDRAARFFEGYAICPGFKQLFEWFTPEWLNTVEVQLAARPDALEEISVWWGALDRVVDLQELRSTENALGVCWSVKVFPGWGHYPMIDSPEEWAQALADAVAPPR